MNAQPPYSRKAKPTTGRLVWTQRGGNYTEVVATGPFAFLNFRKGILKNEPQYNNGTFKVTY